MKVLYRVTWCPQSMTACVGSVIQDPKSFPIHKTEPMTVVETIVHYLEKRKIEPDLVMSKMSNLS